MNESSLTRIKSHIENRNVGLISAFRGRYTKPENLQRTRELESMIRSDGFSFIKMNGHYIEGHGTPNAQDKDEVALFVIGKDGDDNGKLKGALKKYGSSFDQESVLYKAFDKDDAVLIGTVDKNEDGESVWPGLGNESSVGKFNPMRVGEFYTTMKQSKNTSKGKTEPSIPRTFTFETFEFPSSYFQRFSEYIRNRNLS